MPAFSFGFMAKTRGNGRELAQKIPPALSLAEAAAPAAVAEAPAPAAVAEAPGSPVEVSPTEIASPPTESESESRVSLLSYTEPPDADAEQKKQLFDEVAAAIKKLRVKRRLKPCKMHTEVEARVGEKLKARRAKKRAQRRKDKKEVLKKPAAKKAAAKPAAEKAAAKEAAKKAAAKPAAKQAAKQAAAKPAAKKAAAKPAAKQAAAKLAPEKAADLD